MIAVRCKLWLPRENLPSVAPDNKVNMADINCNVLDDIMHLDDKQYPGVWALAILFSVLTHWGKNDRHFADDIFKWILLKKMWYFD